MFNRKFRWILIAPTIHMVLCLAALGYMVPGFGSLGLIFSFLLIVDFPVSFVYGLLAWVNGAIAFMWLIVVGTLWWYLLCRTAEGWITSYAEHKPEPGP
jgi:hypothetical protein